tara:strand:- start:5616 stop:5816 length:201 start_codon:yes stop_codon:yes gene_type:complete
MNTAAARALMLAQRDTLNEAIDALDEHTNQVSEGNWSASVKSRKMASIKAAASRGGVDISAWDGTS